MVVDGIASRLKRKATYHTGDEIGVPSLRIVVKMPVWLPSMVAQASSADSLTVRRGLWRWSGAAP